MIYKCTFLLTVNIVLDKSLTPLSMHNCSVHVPMVVGMNVKIDADAPILMPNCVTLVLLDGNGAYIHV